MSRNISCAIALTFAVATAAAHADEHSSAKQDDNGGCKIVQRHGNPERSNTLSSAVTAGNGRVTAHSTGGSGVTVQAGNGSVSSSTTTTGSGGRTMVTTSDGDCTIYENSPKK